MQRSDADILAQAQQQTRDIPLGPVTGKLNVLAQYNHLGPIRPFGPGEYVAIPNPTGGPPGMTSEESLTVPYQGRWAVVPGLWLVHGVPTKVSEDQAAAYAQRSGLNWPMFDSSQAGDAYAKARELIWERTPQGRTDMQPALWNQPQPSYIPNLPVR